MLVSVSLIPPFGLMASPTTPVDISLASPLDPNYSARATHGGSSPPPTINSPVEFRRQNAFVDDKDIYPTELCPEITGSSSVIGEGPGDVMGGAGVLGNDSTGEEFGEYLEGEESESNSDGLAVLLGSDSDSDEGMDHKERVKVRTGWIHQEYLALKSHNDSFRAESPDWNTFFFSRMQECGYLYQNETWVKIGPPTQDNLVRRAHEKAKAKSRHQPKIRKDQSKIVKKPVKKPAAKTMKKLVLAMKSMKIASSPGKKSPKSSPSKSKGGKGKSGSPSPMKSSPSSSWKTKSPPTTPVKAVRKMAKTPQTPKRSKKNSMMMASTPSEKKKAPRTLRRFESSPVTPKNLTK